MAEGKKRHGCLTALLIVMIVVNAGTALVYLLGSAALGEEFPDAPGWAFPALTALALANTVFALSLWFWKKWGFWGFVGSALITLVVNLEIGVPPGQALAGLVGVALLYGTLQIGDANKGWPQLE